MKTLVFKYMTCFLQSHCVMYSLNWYIWFPLLLYFSTIKWMNLSEINSSLISLENGKCLSLSSNSYDLVGWSSYYSSWTVLYELLKRLSTHQLLRLLFLRCHLSEHFIVSSQIFYSCMLVLFEKCYWHVIFVFFKIFQYNYLYNFLFG